jgi:hypothetical protein
MTGLIIAVADMDRFKAFPGDVHREEVRPTCFAYCRYC